MDEDELRDAMEADAEAIERMTNLMGTIMTEQSLTSVFFLEIIGTCWTYLRTMHDQEDTSQLVRAALVRAEMWMQDEPMIVAYNDDGEEVTVPMYTAEQGGMLASDNAATELFSLFGGGDFEA